jgi:lysophospholipase L1-like esterase
MKIKVRKHSLLIHSALVLVSTLTGLFIAEFFLRLTSLDVPARVETSRIHGLMLPGYPDFYHFIPGRETFVVSLTCEFGYPYRINQLGMRDRSRTVKKQGMGKRILFLGDSFTEGVGVAQEAVYPALIEELKKGAWECLNAGMRGNSPSHAYFRLQKMIAQGLEFDFLVLQLFNNDFMDDANYTTQFQLTQLPDHGTITRAPFHHCLGDPFRLFGPMAYPASRLRIFWHFGKVFMGGEPLTPYTLVTDPDKAVAIETIFKESGVQIEKDDEGNRVRLTFPILSDRYLSSKGQNALWNTWVKPALSDHQIREYHQKMAGIDGTPLSEKGKASLRYLDAFMALCNQHGIPFAVYCAPTSPQRNGLDFSLPIQYWCERHGVDFFYPLDLIYEESVRSADAVYHGLDGHMAEKGHRIVAKAMIPWLETLLGHDQ